MDQRRLASGEHATKHLDLHMVGDGHEKYCDSNIRLICLDDSQETKRYLEVVEPLQVLDMAAQPILAISGVERIIHIADLVPGLI